MNDEVGDTGTETDGDGDGDGDGDPGEALLRVLHLGVDAPAINVYLDDDMDPFIAGLAFESGTDYFPIPAGPTSARCC